MHLRREHNKGPFVMPSTLQRTLCQRHSHGWGLGGHSELVEPIRDATMRATGSMGPLIPLMMKASPDNQPIRRSPFNHKFSRDLSEATHRKGRFVMHVNS